MEFEQIIKRLNWLEKERGKDKENIADLKAKVASLETSLNAANKQVKGLGKQIADVSSSAARLEQFNAMLVKQRADFNKALEANDKNSQRREAEAVKRHQSQLEEINKSVAELRKTFTPGEFNRKFKERAAETQRLINNIADLKTRVETAIQFSESVKQSLQSAEETRRNDLKRVADIQGEITAVRKRAEESREKATLNADGIRNIDNRITELLASEIERKQAQTAFLEQQSLAQVDRDRAWKEWREKVEEFKKDASGLDAHVQILDEALRGAKKAQETYLELNTKLERRINEVTEMQRLTEDRLRQEWVSFKTDDQKRWTGYSLSSEESFRDIRKDVQKFDQRTAALDDASQTMQDQLHQVTDATEQQLQELMNVVHEWMTAYERIMGHGKKAKK
jgi:chromosome segregation ATPase